MPADPAQAADLVDAILPLLSICHSAAGLSDGILGLRNHSTYRDKWQVLCTVPDGWGLLAQG